MNKNTLTDQFLLELFKLCFLKQPVLDAIVKHLKYEYIPVELKEFKKILKSIVTIYRVTNKLPTYGAVSQQHNLDLDVQELLEKIKNSKVADTEVILTQLEDYIKSFRFQLLSDKIFDLYKEGRKDEAISLSAKESEEIARFSIRSESGQYLSLFKDFEDQQRQRRLNAEKEQNEKVPFGIDCLDELTNGGIEPAETALIVARSGIGKSTSLKWIGFMAIRLGYKVLHIQLEGTRQEAYDKYAQVWTALSYNQINKGEIDQEQFDKLSMEAKRFCNAGKDLDIYAFEQFDEASMNDIRNIVIDYERKKGSVPDLVVIDSLDLLNPGDGIKYGVDTQSIKMKLQNTAKRMKNLCVELKTRILTATQTGDVPPTIWNEPDKVITRNNIEGDRTLVKPFSYVFTLNQTNDERDVKEMRIYVDKLRNYSVGEQVFKICTAFHSGRFYDRKRTLDKGYFKPKQKDAKFALN
ncbi:DnaB-like helicase C-terminal domain-containing protein [Thermophagus sp. OGC60D27]|uniref:DnaB-like helicase C-terminal domain-containing protein n=1 Tax=Thermophagus sp. OGC60D27 TaxID=3458415 RepID=UPI0040384341